MRLRMSLIAATLTVGVWLATPAWADRFSFSTGSPDGKLGALSRPASQGLETETADDFVLTQATVVSGATIHGLIPAVSSIAKVEVEIYHIFPLDSDTVRTPSVKTRMNSPSDVEIDAATRDSSEGSLSFNARPISPFMVLSTVTDGINKAPNQTTNGEGPASGEQVEIDISFNPPLFLPAGHYFFRPEVQVSVGNFLFLSAPKPITSAFICAARARSSSRRWRRGRSRRGRRSRPARPTCKHGSATRTWRRIGRESAPTSSAAPRRPRST